MDDIIYEEGSADVQMALQKEITETLETYGVHFDEPLLAFVAGEVIEPLGRCAAETDMAAQIGDEWEDVEVGETQKYVDISAVYRVWTQQPSRLLAPTGQIFAAARFTQGRPSLAQDDGSSPDDALRVPSFTPDVLTPQEREEYNFLTPEQRKAFDEEMEMAIETLRNSDETRDAMNQMERDFFDMERDIDAPTSVPRVRPEGFWAEDEEDEFARAKDGDDHFNDDDVTSIAHTDLDNHRDIRHYARISAWEMPLLSSMFPLFRMLPISKKDRILTEFV
ncbi:28S ribosomal protein S35, mitochondrial [Ascosphaera atra]|nr:28S ribosomal protein S35, mitochondrial [Ascosphaera atra]